MLFHNDFVTTFDTTMTDCITRGEAMQEWLEICEKQMDTGQLHAFSLFFPGNWVSSSSNLFMASLVIGTSAGNRTTGISYVS